MSFMEPEIWEADFYRVETSHGTEIVPVEASGKVATIADLRDYLEGEPYDDEEAIEPQAGWLARMTAPGYLDCTDWSAFETQEEAREYIRDVYDACPDCGEDLDEEDGTCEACDAE